MNAEQIAEIIFALSIALAFSIFLTPVVVAIRKLFYAPSKNEELVQKAIEKNHVVSAKLIKHWDLESVDDPGNMYKEMGIYQYEYHGKTYKYRFIGTTPLPENLTRYFVNNPRKVTSRNELYLLKRSPWIKLFFLTTFLLWMITFFLMKSL